MKNYLVSLVSRQTSPNILCIREMGKVDKYVFIYTEQVKSQLNQILKTLELSENEILAIPVHAVSIQNINDKLKTQGFSHSDKYIVNLTCGTKVMALASFQFFHSFPNARMLYFGSEDKTYQFIHPAIEPFQSIRHQMDIREFLTAYGVEIISGNKKPTRPAAYTNDLFQKFMDNNIPGYDHIKSLRKKKTDKNGFIALDEKQIEVLSNIGFINKDQNKISIRESEYIRGKWFEEYIYDLVRKKSGLGTESLTHGLVINAGGLYDLDVFFMYNNRPYLIECKLSFKKEEGLSKFIYKLSATRNTLGLDLKPVIILLTSWSKRLDKYFNDSVSRAEKHDVTILDRKVVAQGKLESFFDSIFQNKIPSDL